MAVSFAAKIKENWKNLKNKIERGLKNRKKFLKTERNLLKFGKIC